MLTSGKKPQEKSQEASSSQRDRTVAVLTRILNACPAAEELAETWQRSTKETLQEDGPRLQDLRRVLDCEKARKRSTTASSRGFPMWIVVSVKSPFASRRDLIDTEVYFVF
jgi:N-glycosylase/DNA lyase